MGRAATALTVLLVEDEVLISHLVADWLSERGFAVHEAASGDEALDYIGAGRARWTCCSPTSTCRAA